MHTNYTKRMIDKEYTAKEFLVDLTTSFGFTVKYDENDRPVGFDSHNTNPFYQERYDNLVKQKEEWSKLSHEEKINTVKEWYQSDLSDARDTLQQELELDKKYDKVLNELNNIQLSEEFDTLKKFAIEQIKSVKPNIELYKQMIKELESVVDFEEVLRAEEDEQQANLELLETQINNDKEKTEKSNLTAYRLLEDLGPLRDGGTLPKS